MSRIYLEIVFLCDTWSFSVEIVPQKLMQLKHFTEGTCSCWPVYLSIQISVAESTQKQHLQRIKNVSSHPRISSILLMYRLSWSNVFRTVFQIAFALFTVMFGKWEPLLNSGLLWESSDSQGDSKNPKHTLIDVIHPIGPSSGIAFIFSLQASTAIPFLLWISQCIAAVLHSLTFVKAGLFALFLKRRVLIWIKFKWSVLVFQKGCRSVICSIISFFRFSQHITGRLK